MKPSTYLAKPPITSRIRQCIDVLDDIDDIVITSMDGLSTPVDEELEQLRATLNTLLKQD